MLEYIIVGLMAMLAGMLVGLILGGTIVGGLAALVGAILDADYPEDWYVRALGVTTVLVGLIAAVAVPVQMHRETGEGAHVGYVTAVETGGMFWRTTTVYFKTDAAQSQEDAYCAIDPGVIAGLRDAAQRGQRVEIQFRIYFTFAKGCEFDSDTTIVGFRAIGGA